MEEARAIAKLKAGDIIGLGVLVKLYQVEAVQVAYLITNDVAAAEDVVQAAFLRTFDKIEGFDSNRPFRPWFMRMVVNDAIKSAANQKRQESIPEGEDEEYSLVLQNLEFYVREPEEAALREELLNAMRKALVRLTPYQRAAIVMHYFLGLDTATTAGQLKCAPSTVRWHLSMAREKLRVLLAAFK